MGPYFNSQAQDTPLVLITLDNYLDSNYGYLFSIKSIKTLFASFTGIALVILESFSGSLENKAWGHTYGKCFIVCMRERHPREANWGKKEWTRQGRKTIKHRPCMVKLASFTRTHSYPGQADPGKWEHICLKKFTFLNAGHRAKTNPLCVLTDLLFTVVLSVALFHGRGNGCTEMLEGSWDNI